MLTLRTGAAPGASARRLRLRPLAPPLCAPVTPRTWSAPKGFSIIPSNIHLVVTAERAISQHFREQILDRALKRLQGQYDMVLLGCPPNLGVITANAIYAADTILIPTTYGKYSLDGIADLFASMEVLRGDRQGGRYVLRNAVGSRNWQTNDYVDRELENVKELLPGTMVRKTEAINQAQISGEPIFTCDPGGHGAQDSEALTRDMCMMDA
jgi:chromosome partitioning protein